MPYHFAVYAVILNETQDQILLIDKSFGCYKGLLDLPGGRVEDDETNEQGLDREVLEETACTVTTKLPLGPVHANYSFVDDDGRQQVLDHHGELYLARVEGSPSSSGDGIDSAGAFWHSVSTLDLAKCTPFVALGLALARPGF